MATFSPKRQCTWTGDQANDALILQAGQISLAYDSLLLLISFLALFSIILCAGWTRRLGYLNFMGLLPALWHLSVATLTLKTIYFGMPTYLTFGRQIGKVLPATCEASLRIEGENGWPCYAKALIETITKWLQGDDSYDHVLLNAVWANLQWYTTTYLIAGFAVVAFFRGMIWYETRKRSREMKAFGEEDSLQRKSLV